MPALQGREARMNRAGARAQADSAQLGGARRAKYHELKWRVTRLGILTRVSSFPGPARRSGLSPWSLSLSRFPLSCRSISLSRIHAPLLLF